MMTSTSVLTWGSAASASSWLVCMVAEIARSWPFIPALTDAR